MVPSECCLVAPCGAFYLGRRRCRLPPDFKGSYPPSARFSCQRRWASHLFSDQGLPLLAALSFSRCSREGLCPRCACLIFSLASGVCFSPVFASLIFSLVSSERFFCPGYFLPVFACLIFSIVSGVCLLPELASLSFCRVSSDMFELARLSFSRVSLEGLAAPSPPSVKFHKIPVPKSFRPNTAIM